MNAISVIHENIHVNSISLLNYGSKKPSVIFISLPCVVKYCPSYSVRIFTIGVFFYLASFLMYPHWRMQSKVMFCLT